MLDITPLRDNCSIIFVVHYCSIAEGILFQVIVDMLLRTFCLSTYLASQLKMGRKWKIIFELFKY